MFIILVICIIWSSGFFKLDFSTFDWNYFLVISIPSIIVVTISYFFFIQLAENNSKVVNKKLNLYYLLKENDDRICEIKALQYNKCIQHVMNDFDSHCKIRELNIIVNADNIIKIVADLIKRKDFGIYKKDEKKYLINVKNYCYKNLISINELYIDYETKNIINKKRYLGYLVSILVSIIGIISSFFINNFNLLFSWKLVLVIIFYVCLVAYDIYNYFKNVKCMEKYYESMYVEVMNIINDDVI